MSTTLKTFFIRHTKKLDIDQETRIRLWLERLVAVHYPHESTGSGDTDSESLDPEDYTGRAKSAIRYINDLAKSGGYVCAEYFGHDCVLVGKVPPGSYVQLVRGRWGSLNGLDGREAVLKAVKLSQVMEVQPAACATIMAARPRQGTISYWPRAKGTIERLVEGIYHSVTLADLSPDLQEVICSEYLRQEHLPQGTPRLSILLLPIGRTMKDLDLLGLALDGKQICAQVTYSPIEKIRHKMERLRAYAGSDTHLLMFCSATELASKDGVHIIPLECVFDWVTNSEWGGRWLDLNFPIAANIKKIQSTIQVKEDLKIPKNLSKEKSSDWQKRAFEICHSRGQGLAMDTEFKRIIDEGRLIGGEELNEISQATNLPVSRVRNHISHMRTHPHHAKLDIDQFLKEEIRKI